MADGVVRSPNRHRPRPVEVRQPEYERLGISPTAVIPSNYARPETLLPIAIANNRAPLVPETVSAVDGEPFNHDGAHTMTPKKKDGQIIDNNEYLSFGFSPGKLDDAVENGDLIDFDLEVEDKPSAPTVPDVGEYILMIDGNIILSGPLDVIEEKVKGILYGEDIDFEFKIVSQEDMIVLKRVEIQVGVFIKD